MVLQEKLDMKTQGTEHRAQGAGHRAQSAGHRAQGAGRRAQGHSDIQTSRHKDIKWDQYHH